MVNSRRKREFEVMTEKDKARSAIEEVRAESKARFAEIRAKHDAEMAQLYAKEDASLEWLNVIILVGVTSSIIGFAWLVMDILKS